MSHQQAIEQLKTDLSINKDSYTQDQLMQGYETLMMLIGEYLLISGVN